MLDQIRQISLDAANTVLLNFVLWAAGGMLTMVGLLSSLMYYLLSGLPQRIATLEADNGTMKGEVGRLRDRVHQHSNLLMGDHHK